MEGQKAYNKIKSATYDHSKSSFFKECYVIKKFTSDLFPLLPFIVSSQKTNNRTL